jgi:hypothetical protein
VLSTVPLLSLLLGLCSTSFIPSDCDTDTVWLILQHEILHIRVKQCHVQTLLTTDRWRNTLQTVINVDAIFHIPRFHPCQVAISSLSSSWLVVVSVKNDSRCTVMANSYVYVVCHGWNMWTSNAALIRLVLYWNCEDSIWHMLLNCKNWRFSQPTFDSILLVLISWHRWQMIQYM